MIVVLQIFKDNYSTSLVTAHFKPLKQFKVYIISHEVLGLIKQWNLKGIEVNSLDFGGKSALSSC